MLSDRTIVSMSKFLKEYSRKIVVTIIALVFVVDIAFVYFEKRSVITKMYWLPFFLLRR